MTEQNRWVWEYKWIGKWQEYGQMGRKHSKNETGVTKDKCSLYSTLAFRWAHTSNHPQNPIWAILFPLYYLL